VDSTPLEQQIGDLELAIDRLRSLYDQYFMGIERLEPAVVRKDVDRKIYQLRKEQIRNTALRFRFQMILQRYNTFQSHWQRICREIENGTYKRQLYRAERRQAATLPDATAPEVTGPEPEPEPAPLRDTKPETGPPAFAAKPLPEPGAPAPAPKAMPEPGAVPADDLAAELAELDKEFAPAAPAARAVPGGPDRTMPPGRGPLPRVTAPPPRRPPLPTATTKTPPGPPVVMAKEGPPAIPAAAGAIPAPATLAAAKATAAPAAPAPAKPPTPPSRSDDGLPEYRVRQLYVEYVEAKRRQKESTAAVTYENLAESLRASSARLREKHGKPIDFEVGIKDGKAVLRPRVK
jgi:hypothetical protein